MTDPTAVLDIGYFKTTLTVHVDGGRQRHNIIGTSDDGDWNNDHVTYFRNAADRELAAAGWTRSSGWQFDAGRDAHTAPIGAIERSAA